MMGDVLQNDQGTDFQTILFFLNGIQAGNGLQIDECFGVARQDSVFHLAQEIRSTGYKIRFALVSPEE